jgi:CRP/FNR family cyclic AMP-dependent transcriptional regulator
MQTLKSNLIAALRRLPLFNELSEQELEVISERVKRRKYEADEMIFSEGEACHELLIVEAGEAKVFKSASNGREQLIAIERAGNSLAEFPLFDEGRHSSTARAIVETSLLELPAEHFRIICMQYPKVAIKVIRVLGHRLRHMDGLVEKLSFSTVRGRLIAHLLQLAEDHGRPDGNRVDVELLENNEELAARLGTVRELISRNLGRLHGEGLIEMRRRAVTIPDVRKLKNEMSRDD